MIERNTASKSASSVFYEEYNDIDIYVEDSAPGYKKIFKELINKALGSKFKIEQIFPLGDRNAVISECSKNQSASHRKRVYVVDGDLFLLNGNDRDDLKGLFILPRYCIENYFIDQDAIAATAYEEDSEMEVDQIISTLDFDTWLSENEKLLLDLFIIYAICFKNLPAEKTVGHKVGQLCSSNSGIVCPKKIEARIQELRNKLIRFFGEEKLELEINLIKEKIKSKDRKLIKYVSAKDYLLPLMITRLQSFLKFGPNSVPLKIRLAMRAEVEDLKIMEDFIF